MAIEFVPWPKTPRLNRTVTITEKIDGTNAAVGVQAFPFGFHVGGIDDEGVSHDQPAGATLVMGSDLDETGLPNTEYLVYAQSRKRLITPDQDNYGFARWVYDNAQSLAETLGEGLHFGEWWGSGIQRGYGLPQGDKRFSLFNMKRWQWMRDYNTPDGCGGRDLPPGLDCVPVLYEGPIMQIDVYYPPWVNVLDDLRHFGSSAVPGFMNPEGIVLYHHAAGHGFKVTLENDDAPKLEQAA